MTLRI